MLRCPKCGRIYQDGSQRFCTFDGGRLLPVSESAPFVPPQIVSFEQSKQQQPQQQPQNFNIPLENKENTASAAAPPQNTSNDNSYYNDAEQNHSAPPLFKTNTGDMRKRATGRLTKPESFNPENFSTLNPPFSGNSSGGMATPQFSPAYSNVDDPARFSGKPDLNLSFTTPEKLIGQNVKGRYFVEHFLRTDSLGAVYAAQDRFTPGKRVNIYVVLRELRPEDISVKKFQEDKAAISQITHPGLAGILDSGELVDGKTYLVSEYVEGKTLREAMSEVGQFDALRTARIIRQIAQVLSETHNNRLLHRDLKPESIVLKPIEGGLEQVRIVDFGLGNLHAGLPAPNENLDALAYQSPERLLGQPLSAESDIFSLAAIAYQMLTGYTPFQYRSVNDLMENQRKNLASRPTVERSDLSSVVDAVLQKALTYSPVERYHQAREFGESLFGALSDNVPHSILMPPVSPAGEIRPNETVAFVPAPLNRAGTSPHEPSQPDFSATAPVIVPDHARLETASAAPGYQAETATSATANIAVKPNAASVAAKKSSFLSLPLILAGLLGFFIFLGVLGAIGWYLLAQKSEPTVKKIETPQTTPTPVTENIPVTGENTNSQPTNTSEIAQPSPTVKATPETAAISIPEGYTAFKNDKSNLDGKLAQNFTAFSLAYPMSWQKNPKSATKGANNFLDIANRVADQKPIEQFLISWYGSGGTFEADSSKFKTYSPQLKGLYSKDIPNYQQISEGETTFNSMKAYEVKFQGETKDANDASIKIWGRTVFLPVGKSGAKSGLMITTLATSLAPEFSSVDDLAQKGDLAKIIKTFKVEPE